MSERFGRHTVRLTAFAMLVTAGTLAGSLSVNAQSRSASAPSEAFTKALAEYDRVWNENGLAFTTITFTDGPGTGYGRYVPLDTASVAAGDTLTVYAEPVGYTFSQTDAGYSYRLTASYKLLNTSGQVLAEQDNFAEFSGSGRSKERELSATLSFRFSGLPAGDYRIETTFTDEVGEQSASFTLPFAVTAAK